MARPLAAPPDILRWSPRSIGHGDCAVAALEIACGVTYEVALAASVLVRKTVLRDGLEWSHMKAVARRLGFEPKVLSHFSLDDDTGILYVVQPHVDDSDHVVYLWEGRIIEPMNARQQLWLNAEDFLRHYHYQHKGLLVLTPKK